jgi:hypothetical protein
METPTIYEVFKRVLQQRDEGDALRAVAVMQQGSVVDLDVRLALSAARLSLDTRLPMADSVILGQAPRRHALDAGRRLRRPGRRALPAPEGLTGRSPEPGHPGAGYFVAAGSLTESPKTHAYPPGPRPFSS